ncbi:hypothetical protein [Curtobacterium sp. MCBD17_028]|uniref:hypothetical protein n=1 Tax=Curtobacterium sp. MCBD17_028 TaxID=2175670 RepID=UPI000DA8CDCB|nr:hypothetical protein [Curtobacterium sp. MCBD17_028]PZE23873.1 hypothetical protein DEI86_13600 [Curtobacterium sp. MCBD17_028]
MTDTIETEELAPEIRIGLKAATARRRLEDLPELVAYIRSLVVPTLGGAKDGMPRAASKEPPLPMRADAADDADAIWRQLIEWVDFWASVFQVKPPAAAQAAWRNENGDLLGFRPHITPPGAGVMTKYLVDWLLVRHEAIADKQSGELYYDDVADLQQVDHERQSRSSIWGKYPRAPRRQRPVLPRPCPVCDHYAYGAEWPDGGQPEDVVLRCEHCGHVDEQPLTTSKGARQVIVELREERQSWDRRGVLAFYDMHGYYPTEEEPLDRERSLPVCGALTLVDGRTFVCTLLTRHEGDHSAAPGGDGKRFEWPRKEQAA